MAQPEGTENPAAFRSRVDKRNPPDLARCRAFMQGWNDAVAGKLYDSIFRTKTHANMGNLFGWIYGDKPDDFKQQTWEQYIESLD